MSKVQATLTYIKDNPFDVLTMVFGIIAATLVSFKFPQPYLWIAFPCYVVSAASAVKANYSRGNYPLLVLFGYYLIIDSIGVIRWWPF